MHFVRRLGAFAGLDDVSTILDTCHEQMTLAGFNLQVAILQRLEQGFSPSRSGAGRGKEAYCFTASNCLLRVRVG